jgi:hypothetical protein
VVNVGVQGYEVDPDLQVIFVAVFSKTLFGGKVNLNFPPYGMSASTVNAKTYSVALPT